MPDQRDMGKLLECAQVFDDKGFREAWLVTLATTGLRTSEARALKWQNVHLEEAVPRIFVTERADRWCKVGPVKSDAGERDVLLFPETAAVLKRWRHSGPVTPYVFPTASGRIWHYHNFYHRVWVPWCRNAGLVTPLIDAKTGGQGAYKDGRLKWTPTVAQHQLRHAAASFMIAMGVQPKELQTFMGHSSIQITYDRYGHLWRASAFDAAFQARGDAEIRRLFPTLPAPGND